MALRRALALLLVATAAFVVVTTGADDKGSSSTPSATGTSQSAVPGAPLRGSAPVSPGYTEPRFTSYEYDFGSEHGFGASATVARPFVSPEIVENLKEEADAGSKGAWC